MKLRKILKQPRVMILLFVLLSSFIAIGHQFESNGVSISFVEKNSTAEIYGLENPESNIQPVKREKIIEINKNKILNLKDYATEISKIKDQHKDEVILLHKELLQVEQQTRLLEDFDRKKDEEINELRAKVKELEEKNKQLLEKINHYESKWWNKAVLKKKGGNTP